METVKYLLFLITKSHELISLNPLQRFEWDDKLFTKIRQVKSF